MSCIYTFKPRRSEVEPGRHLCIIQNVAFVPFREDGYSGESLAFTFQIIDGNCKNLSYTCRFPTSPNTGNPEKDELLIKMTDQRLTSFCDALFGRKRLGDFEISVDYAKCIGKEIGIDLYNRVSKDGGNSYLTLRKFFSGSKIYNFEDVLIKDSYPRSDYSSTDPYSSDTDVPF